LVKNASSLILYADMCQNPGNKGWSPYSIENPGEFKGGGRGGSTSTTDTPITPGPDKDSGNNAWMRYRHSGSVNAVMGDGSARSFKKGTVLSSNAKIVQ
jgi:prepilin-type processing-associated H-X9-DG protein